jgi:hypothetical protein
MLERGVLVSIDRRRPHHGQARTRSVPAVAAALLGLVVALVAMPLGAVPFGASAGTCAVAAPAGHQRIAVVVDGGTVPGGPSGVRSICVTVPGDATGADALAAAVGSIRWDPSGLLCGIDGVPAAGCGERTDQGYRYWAYFTSSGGSWRHSSIGPSFRRADPSVVEGWRYVQGSGGPSDPPPRGSATASTICPAEPSPPSATAPQAPGLGAPPPAHGGPPASIPEVAAAVPAAGLPVTPPPGPAGAPLEPTSADGDLPGEVEPPAVDVDGTGDEAFGSRSDRDDESGQRATGAGPAAAGELAAAVGSTDDSGSPLGVLAGALLVAGLGVVAALRFRRAR